MTDQIRKGESNCLVIDSNFCEQDRLNMAAQSGVAAQIRNEDQ